MEKLIQQIKQKANACPSNTRESRARKGAYVDCLVMAKEVKTIEGLDEHTLRGKLIPITNLISIIDGILESGQIEKEIASIIQKEVTSSKECIAYILELAN